MGKGAIPVCTWWDGERLGYLEAHRRVYMPIYAMAVAGTDAFAKLRDFIESGKTVWMLDFDGYDHFGMGKSIGDVLDDPKRKAGHAFVLAGLLTGEISIP
jgi:hypothetical protein